ncbi:MAG: hypothetical protein M3Y82_15030 [Verrucomicrobiota bacterium]|nr:hypothetical protein [Verrucomicrobiota bacterium]
MRQKSCAQTKTAGDSISIWKLKTFGSFSGYSVKNFSLTPRFNAVNGESEKEKPFKRFFQAAHGNTHAKAWLLMRSFLQSQIQKNNLRAQISVCKFQLSSTHSSIG